MKKTIIALLFPVFSFAQSNFYIKKCVDQFSGKTYVYSSEMLICADGTNQSLRILPSWTESKSNVVYNGFIVKSANIGVCNENDEIYFIFSDGDKKMYKSWNDFNCTGTSYFDYESNAINDFFDKEVTAIRFVNGRSRDQFTYYLKGDEKNYFINMKSAYLRKDVRLIDCPK